MRISVKLLCKGKKEKEELVLYRAPRQRDRVHSGLGIRVSLRVTCSVLMHS